MEITKIASITTGINIHDFFPDYTCHDYLSLIFFNTSVTIIGIIC